jgi:hypothetical protein
MSYSTDTLDGFRHAGTYVGKKHQRNHARRSPDEQASKFVFVINLKTAKALGIAVPPTLLSLADEVIKLEQSGAQNPPENPTQQNPRSRNRPSKTSTPPLKPDNPPRIYNDLIPPYRTLRF